MKAAPAGLVAWLFAAVALAQPIAPPVDAGTASGAADGAQRAFEEGVRAAHEGRWPDALERFREAYALRPDPRILVNVAAAQVNARLLVAGAETYRRYLTESDQADSAARAAAERALHEVEARLARAQVRIVGLAGTDTVKVDGESIAQDRLADPLVLDPGQHRLAVYRDGQLASPPHDFDIAEGATAQIDLVLQPAQASAPPRRSAPAAALGLPRHHREESSTVWESPWLWLGAGALVVAGVTTALVIAATAGTDRPVSFTGNLMPGVLEVR